ncbi:MAG: 2OG-Fe(II) oxygenase [Azospirillaceae bacterium]
MASRIPSPPEPGERLPDFLLPSADGRRPTFNERFLGAPVVLLLIAGSGDDAAALATAARQAGAGVHRLRPAGKSEGEPGAADPTGVADQLDDGRLARALIGETGAAGAVALVVDATGRLAARLDSPEPGALADAVTDLGQGGRVEAAPVFATAAPVLIVPGVLDPDQCARLIAAHAADNVESGMLRAQGDDTVLAADAVAKRRRDHTLDDPDLVAMVTERLGRRVLPEIARSFHYPVTRFERFKIAAYDAAEGGHFAAHRDNTTPDARHRRFALSLNLDDGYDGGTLAFPEFGPAEYRPPAGGAIVFSCGHMHVARPVTAGRRHVLISFFWGEEARAGGPARG